MLTQYRRTRMMQAREGLPANLVDRADRRRNHYRRGILFLWSAQLPLSRAAGDRAYLLYLPWC